MTDQERDLLIAIGRAVVELLGNTFDAEDHEMTTLRLVIGYHLKELQPQAKHPHPDEFGPSERAAFEAALRQRRLSEACASHTSLPPPKP